MRDTLCSYRSADALVKSTHVPTQCIVAFAQLLMNDDSVHWHGNTPWEISSHMTEKDRFYFLAVLVWASTLHHEGDVTCVLFSQLIDKIEHDNHPGLWKSSTDCIRTCDAYAIFVGRQPKPTFQFKNICENNDDFANVILSTIGNTPGIWKLSFFDGIPLHELILHCLGNEKYRIVQSNVEKYTLAEFCFHMPKSPARDVQYAYYGLPYTASTMSSTKDQVSLFLNNVCDASLIPEFDNVQLSILTSIP